ncbi:hypothetical protein DMN91_010146 [Ooceraea biroi]|uniref:Leucine-rich repeat-containing protein n=2 Tax=Ooceraea biroi TaxID=2015173 RepID=A0A3L8DBN3_OOCBI|nr:leucine-rich repeat-containing protein 45-like isoform X1 [Ooceraea biroi]RLU17907.1 hypothetical protein DMN91_010146 [Ooceraea biroi]
MLQDHELFVRLCQKRGISSIPEISDAFRASSTTGELRLSCLSIIIPVCEIIAQTLVSSATIKTLDMSDCMLLPKGLDGILDALCEGTAVTTLKLKGNNVNGPIVTHLGRVLACNNTLKRLHVEWNSMGAHADSFAAFCDGLTRNHNIEQLDLRYNQISPQCAEHLCRVIQRNKSLRSIDLSWNTLGLQGGRLLLNAIGDNKTITDLVLRGNCVPEDIALAMEERLRENRRRCVATEFVLPSADVASSPPLTAEKQGLMTPTAARDAYVGIISSTPEKPRTSRGKGKVHKASQGSKDLVQIADEISPSIETKSEANVGLEDGNRGSSARGDHISLVDRDDRVIETEPKLADLNEMLRERSAAIDLLTDKLAMKVAEVDDTRAQLGLLQTEIHQLQQEKARFDSDKAGEIARLQKNHSEAEENWRRSYKDLKNNYNECSRNKKEADFKIRQYEKEIHKSSLELGLLRDKLVSATRAYEDLLSNHKTEMHRLRRESKERDNKHRIELNILKSTLRETTQALEDCQTELQKSRGESRDLSENQALLKAKLDDAERKVLRYARIEENCQRLKEEKNTLQEKLVDSQRTVSSLQRQVTSLEGELIEPERRYNLLKEELDLEKQTNERFKRELGEERARLKDQAFQAEKMNQQLAALNARLNEVQTTHAEVLRERDRERKQLQEIISSKERNLSRLRTEEVQRTEQLYAAFTKYLSSLGPSPVT